MLKTQIYEFLEGIYKEVTGQEGVVKEDLSNISDVGATLLSANYREPYTNSLLNRIGRMVFVDRPYKGFAPNIIREAWEYGSIMSKSRVKDFTPTANMAWNLTPGESVDQFVYTPPTVQTTLYNQMVAWEIDCSFLDDQLKQSFTSAAEYDRFISMIVTQIQNSEVQQIDSLVMRNVNAMAGRRIYRNIAVVDLLAGYNATVSSPITAAEAATNKDFARYTAYQILLYKDRMKAKTAAFCENEEGYTTFTPAEYLHLVLLSDFAKSIDVYLQSDTYHNDFTEIGSYETVPFWQGSGTFALADTSAIYAELPGIDGNPTVDRNYVLGVMFDRDACGIINERRNVAVSYNNRGRYWNNFYQVETRLFTDPAENCIVFVLGSGTGTVPTISLGGTVVRVEEDATATLIFTVTPAGATVTWESSDEEVATVSSSGTVTGVAEGRATITAFATNDSITRTASCDVIVTAT